MVRAKFTVSSKTTTETMMNGKKVEVVTVRAMPAMPKWLADRGDGTAGYDPTDPNYAWWSATPTGSIELGTVNKAAADALAIGEAYYVDFTPVAEAAPDAVQG